jgi:hypothetical protein
MLLAVSSSACVAPLMRAAEQGDVERVRQLLDQGADINEVSYGLNRWTALHGAAWKGHPEIARLLIRRGADVNAVTNTGLTALQVAQGNGHQDVVAVILEETGRAVQQPAQEVKTAQPRIDTQPPPQEATTDSLPEEPVSLHARALVMELRPVGKVPAHVPPLATKLLLAKLDDVKGLKTVSPEDLQLLLSVEKQKDALGCDDVKCMAEIGGALGTDYVIYGQIGIVGSQYSLNLTAIDSKKNVAAARVSVLVAANEDALMQSVPGAVASLLAKIAGPTAKTP